MNYEELENRIKDLESELSAVTEQCVRAERDLNAAYNREAAREGWQVKRTRASNIGRTPEWRENAFAGTPSDGNQASIEVSASTVGAQRQTTDSHFSSLPQQEEPQIASKIEKALDRIDSESFNVDYGLIGRGAGGLGGVVELSTAKHAILSIRQTYRASLPSPPPSSTFDEKAEWFRAGRRSAFTAMLNHISESSPDLVRVCPCENPHCAEAVHRNGRVKPAPPPEDAR